MLISQIPNTSVRNKLIKAGFDPKHDISHYQTFDSPWFGIWDESPLCYAARCDDVELTKVLLECGADVNSIEQAPNTSSAFAEYESPLIVAIKYGRAEIARLLLIKNADIKRTYEGNNIESILGESESQSGILYRFSQSIMRKEVDFDKVKSYLCERATGISYHPG